MKPPVVRAIARGEHGIRVSWFELFYDLVVVASVSNGSHLFGEHPSWGMGTWLAASLILLMTFWLLTMLSHNLYPGDGTERHLLVLVQMVALIISSLALGRGDEGLPDTVGFAALAVAYLSIALVYWRCGRRSAGQGKPARVLARSSLLAAAVMLLGVVVPSEGSVLVNPLTWIFVIGMLCGSLPLLFIVLNHRTTAGQIDAAHLSERMGQLVLIVLGESFVSLVLSLNGQSRIPNPWYFLLDFVVVFAIWTMYFRGIVPSGVPATSGRLRAWLGLHVVFIFGAIATADAFAALTLIPFDETPTVKGFWTPLPLLYVMLGLLGLSILAAQPRAVRRMHLVITVILALLAALARLALPEQARWLMLLAAALVVLDAVVMTLRSRREPAD